MIYLEVAARLQIECVIKKVTLLSDQSCLCFSEPPSTFGNGELLFFLGTIDIDIEKTFLFEAKLQDCRV